MNRTEIFAHRGASGYAPENTLEAFALAIEQGADGIELDVQLSKDGIPVVIHDETIDRVTEKKGWVKDYTLQELKDMTVLKDKFPAYTQSKIPTLKEVLEAVKPSGIQVNIELKYDGYIKRQMRQVEQFNKLENKRIPDDIDYHMVYSLRKEAEQKLSEIRPASVGQASRISGVSPADISVLLVYLESGKNKS